MPGGKDSGREEVLIEVPAFSVSDRTFPATSKRGNPYLRRNVTLPRGVVVDGRDLGGARFSTPDFTITTAENGRSKLVHAGRSHDILLQVPVRGEDGRVVTDPDGKWVYKEERMAVGAEQLAAAFRAEREAYLEGRGEKASHEEHRPDFADEGIPFPTRDEMER